ncbi:hypothetical protein [Clostridium sp.]|uniref:hypothetical protein n=1 Tax=Clostridium sp. TaxID=1506 RepID=UPI00261929E0|nr:hypothetical protein [Clostridium sp.]
MIKDKFEELKEISQPLVNFLNKHYNPHTIAIVKEGRVEILIEDMCVPLEVRD